MLRRPGPKLLAFLLGMAFGVMFTLSAVRFLAHTPITD